MKPTGAQRHGRSGRRPKEREPAKQTAYNCRATVPGVNKPPLDGSHVVAGMFVPTLERELGDSGFVEFS